MSGVAIVIINWCQVCV